MQRRIGNGNLSTGYGLLAIVLWSGTFALARSLSERVGAIAAGAAVYLLGGLLLCLLRLPKIKTVLPSLKALRPAYLFGCGALFVLYTVLVYVAVGMASDRQQLLEIALLNYLWPALTIIFSIPLLGKRARPSLIPGTLLALSGVFLVMTQGADLSWPSFWSHFQTNPDGYLMAIVAAVAWALYSNLARRWSSPEAAGAVELFIPITGLILLLINIFGPQHGNWNLHAGLEALVLGAITGLAYFLWEIAMRKGNLLLVAACSYFTPLLSTLVSCLYLQILPGPKLWLGCLLVAVGSLLSWRSIIEKPAPDTV